MIMTKPVCIITGVGPGTGSALARRFSLGGYHVALLARSEKRIPKLQAELPDASAHICDVTQEGQVNETVAKIARDFGPPTVAVHNAVGGAFGNFLEVDPAILETNFKVNTMGLLYLARAVAPSMIDAKKGAIIGTGNTSAYRGVESFAAFAPTKAAERILLESIARHLGPKGVHVSFLMIDAVINVPWARKMYHDKPEDFFADPAAIADEIWHITHQPRSAWSFNYELRPYAEKW
ncbi:SDR family NAD(P)-dependent oxidoreductase [Bradyrhizobium sp. CSA207]|uniref:SDR family NAD(P)-dependent oxidoreductase n=1 Tax=Bradyrhizobium sp. CSA207 TaxID=2698826 RepID=UPI0023AF7798|nr:SDR family NAD(P)-dependent oxidoreductase [Bradyrhizobium sp. CSA207]